MKRPRKSNRVSWAPGVNLCQVKMFLSDDCPSKSKDELSRVPRIKWKCPPQFVFSYNWHVAAGEESREKEDQKMREMRVLEAVYPRLSAIPPSPSVSLNVEEEDYDDSLTPLVPLIPIEEEESMDINPEVAAAVDIPIATQSQNLHQNASATSTPISSQCNNPATVTPTAYEKPLPGVSSGLNVDLAAAYALAAAIMKSNEQGSEIDMDLLVKIFNDPILIEKLIAGHRIDRTTENASSDTVGVPTSAFKPAIPSAPMSSLTPDKPASGISPTGALGLSASGLMPAAASNSLLMPTSNKPATPSVSFSKSMPEKSVNIVPFSRPMPDKPATTVSFSKPMPEKPSTPSFPLPATTLDMHRPVNKTIPHLSNGVLSASNTLIPQQDAVLASGVKRAESLASISSNSETNMVSMPSAGGNLHAVANQVQPTVSTMPYQPSTTSSFAPKEAYPVKDANYYKNLIRQHGADKQDMLDSQIGIRHNNFKDLKTVHNHKPGEVKFKTQKPCIYFNSSRGCRNGSNCPYQHDVSVQWGAGSVLGSQNTKRLKLGPEINGRT
ncbi:hypothetical protein L6164_027645 [Bauhinia variegata]|uniref:Uncharacterized protein n=1 Tax=Bauhinia variegata TaxID=167791 RepID=A0ACB9LU05_BAUVA|nr:hypothetical protein L6164_027645 [Bauhinia variegata]